MKTKFEEEVDKFKKWASEIEDRSAFSEWEYYYERWDKLYKEFEKYLSFISYHNLVEKDIKNFIYILARDNEAEEIISILGDNVDWFESLLPHVLKSDEWNAKWQYAMKLGEGIISSIQAEDYLLKFVNDSNEYVRRRALQSLGKIGSKHAEYYCKVAWNSNHEYQRIQALWTLKEINSKNLKNYLTLAEKDGRDALLSNVVKILNA